MITQALSIQGRLSPRGFDKALRRWLPLCYACVIAVSLTEPRILLIRSDAFHWHYWLRVAVLFLAAITCLKMDILITRRLHDSDRAGWWCAPIAAIQVLGLVLLALVTGVRADDPRWLHDNPVRAFLPLWGIPYALLALALLFLPAMVLVRQIECPGTAGENRFGPRPGC